MSINFLSIPNEVKLMVYQKMENLEIMKMGATCSFADRFVQHHKRYLNSRIDMGESVVLEATKDGISIRKEEWTEKSMNKYLHSEDEDFHKNIAPIAIKKLKIVVKETSTIDRVLTILKKWQPICKIATIFGNIPSEVLTEMSSSIRYSENITLQCPREDGSQLFSNLAKVRNPEKHTLILPSYAKYNDILEKTREFGSFEGELGLAKFESFLFELNASRKTGNLRRATFTIVGASNIPEMLNYPLLILLTDLPKTTVLFKTCHAEASKWGARSVLKLALNDGNCALISESNVIHPVSKILDVRIVKDDEEYILNLLINILGIDESHFPEKSRKAFFAMGYEQRILELQIADTMSQEIERFKKRLKNIRSINPLSR